MTKPRLRFAPSPTGHLHIGGARTALYNWLIAQKTGGTFVLRVEDTDRERSTQEYVDSIMQAMTWLGLSWQEGPFFQTQRFDLYREHMQKLLAEKKAYRCYCTAEELEAKRAQATQEHRKPKYEGTCRNLTEADWAKETRPFCIRFKAPQEGSTLVKDEIKGNIEFQNKEMDDLIIWRTDDSPTYNFTVVVDDVTMNITHVIRGDDHLNNTPRQILLYEAFDYPLPIFAHVPMILGADKARLSKRHGATSVIAYRDMGYLPEALLNYLARLGWSYGDKEVMRLKEMVNYFETSAVGKSPSIFNPEKLLWLNGIYIRESKPEDLAEELIRLFKLREIEVENNATLIAAIKASQEKSKTLAEMADLVEFAFLDHVPWSEAGKKMLENEKVKDYFGRLIPKLEALNTFDRDSLHQVVETCIAELGIKLKELAQPIRAALTGTTISIGIYEAMLLLGKEKSLERLKNCLKD
ncbi:MAG: glutamate--tRNA ligase [Deltaproteobacteria bacterium]|nr:glutamate--tRNA ligase [Deltaproteobacteria bacterium]